jgi:hypothetical protein
MTMWLVLPPVVYQAMDSRAYVFSFALRRARDLPGDLRVDADLREISYGVFLPQFKGKLGQAPHPPTAIVVTRSSLVVGSHIASGHPCRMLPLRDLEYVEYGHCLLQGWISISAMGSISSFPFNTRTSRPVEELLRILALAWTPVTLDLPDSRHVSSGPELDLKFHNAEVAALCAGEGVLVRFFSPACSVESRTWAGSTSKCNEPGDYLAITERRLLWITERHRGSYERYGSILRFAPLKNVTDIFVHYSGRNSGIIFGLKGGTRWCIPLSAQDADRAVAFVHQALSMIRSAVTQYPD